MKGLPNGPRRLSAFGLRDLGELDDRGRARERYRRVGVTGASAALTRAVGIAVALATVPLAIRYLGPELYGVWVTVTSLSALVVVADLGLGQGLVNGLAAAEGRDDQGAARELVASAFFMLVLVAAAVGGAFALAHPRIPWGSLLNVSSPAAAGAAADAVAVLVAVTLVGLPLSLAARVREGWQEGHVANAWLAAGSLVALAGLVAVIRLDGSLPWLVLAVGAGPAVAMLGNGAALLAGRPELVPRPRHVSWAAAGRLLRLGGLFFVIVVSGVGSFQLDNLVVARILGAEQVTQFAVPMKLFAFVPMVAGFGLRPLWPAYREALARGDHPWFVQALGRSFRAAVLIGAGASLALLVVAVPVIRIWAGSAVDPSASLLVGLACYAALLTFATAQAMLLYAIEALRFVAALAVASLALNLGASIALTHAIGIPGPAWGSVIALALIVAVNVAYIRREVRRRVAVGSPA